MDNIYIPMLPEVRKDINSASEYEVFALCYALYQRGKAIYFSNGYLAEVLNKSERAISKIIAKLERKGYLRRIINGCSRTIEIIIDKIKDMDKGRTKVHTPRTKVLPQSMNKSSIYNIEPNNKIDERDTLDLEIEKYFNSICTYTDIDIKLITTKFMNKYLHSKASIRKNRNNWEGLANNFYISWVSYLKPTENNDVEPQETSEIKKLMKQYGNPKNVVVNGWKYDFNGENICSYDFKGQSRAVRLWDIFKEWIKTPDKWEIVIDGGLIK